MDTPTGNPVDGRAGGAGLRWSLGLLCLIGLVVGALAWAGAIPLHGTKPAPPSAPAATDPAAASDNEISGAEKKLGLLQDKLSNRIIPALTKFRADRDDLKTRLKALGVNDSKGLKENFKAQSLGQELAEDVGLIRVMEQKQAAAERSSFELESLIRRLKRKSVAENAGLTEQELAEVASTLKTIDAQLADVTEAVPDLNPAQVDALIDDELGANTVEGRIDRLLDARAQRIKALGERLEACKAVVSAASSNASDVANFQSRLQRAYRQGLDEDRWPIKVAGRMYEQRAAEVAIARATQFIERQQKVPSDMAPLMEPLEKAIATLKDEASELTKLKEQSKADADKPGDKEAEARQLQVKARVSTLAEQSVPPDKDPLLTQPAPKAEEFDPSEK